MSVMFFVPGPPVAKGRGRVGKNAAGHAMVFTPTKTRRYEDLVRLAAAQAMAGRPVLDVPLTLTLAVGLPIPQSWSKRKQAAAAAGEVRATKKPDLDNVAKAIKDGCNQVVWRDDSLVVAAVLSKTYAITPGVKVTVHLAEGVCA